jgi:hypothetical protein
MLPRENRSYMMQVHEDQRCASYDWSTEATAGGTADTMRDPRCLVAKQVQPAAVRRSPGQSAEAGATFHAHTQRHGADRCRDLRAYACAQLAMKMRRHHFAPATHEPDGHSQAQRRSSIGCSMAIYDCYEATQIQTDYDGIALHRGPPVSGPLHRAADGGRPLFSGSTIKGCHRVHLRTARTPDFTQSWWRHD